MAAAEYERPATPEEWAQLVELAAAKGKREPVEEAIAAKGAEGPIPFGWVERQRQRFATLPDAPVEGAQDDATGAQSDDEPAGQPAASPEPENGSQSTEPVQDATPEVDSNAPPPGDRWASADELDAVAKIAAAAGVTDAYRERLNKECAEFLGVRGSWLAIQVKHLMEKLKQKPEPEGAGTDWAAMVPAGVRSQLEGGAPPSATDDDVAAAFAEDVAAGQHPNS